MSPGGVLFGSGRIISGKADHICIGVAPDSATDSGCIHHMP